MAIFKKKPKKEEVVMASAPEELESEGEIKYTEKLADKDPSAIQTEYREVPVCMSQEQINNLVIENNIMLKQIISEME